MAAKQHLPPQGDTGSPPQGDTGTGEGMCMHLSATTICVVAQGAAPGVQQTCVSNHLTNASVSTSSSCPKQHPDCQQPDHNGRCPQTQPATTVWVDTANAWTSSELAKHRRLCKPAWRVGRQMASGTAATLMKHAHVTLVVQCVVWCQRGKPLLRHSSLRCCCCSCRCCFRLRLSSCVPMCDGPPPPPSPRPPGSGVTAVAQKGACTCARVPHPHQI